MPGLDRQFELEVLVGQLHVDPIKCPSRCSCYENRKLLQLKRLLAYLPSKLGSALRGFSKLPWQVQIVIIVSILLTLILALAPQWVPAIADLVRAFRGT